MTQWIISHSKRWPSHMVVQIYSMVGARGALYNSLPITLHQLLTPLTSLARCISAVLSPAILITSLFPFPSAATAAYPFLFLLAGTIQLHRDIRPQAICQLQINLRFSPQQEANPLTDLKRDSKTILKGSRGHVWHWSPSILS